jgi:hypothetical protein
MHATLLLNASYEPLRIISWKKALTLFFAGKVEIIEEHDREIHAITFAIKLPSIIRLLKYVRVKNQNKVKFRERTSTPETIIHVNTAERSFPPKISLSITWCPSQGVDSNAGITSSRPVFAAITKKADVHLKKQACG